jgi:S-methylmethionine-dependent homocysteine/selenocysteine methylase
MLKELITSHPRILAECAIAERLRRHPDVRLHPTLFNTPLIYGPAGARDIMVGIYREYLSVAREAGLPLLLTAPTWRLDGERVAKAGVPTTINADAVAFLRGVRDRFASEFPVLVGALTGPQNDCYRPDLAPDAVAAQRFHSKQIQELGATEADFLQAQTLPSVGEALGVARAMAATGREYIISFCTGVDGRVLDGTPLPQAMALIDEDTQLVKPPVGYYVNCTHPQFLLDAYEGQPLERLLGIQANGSSKDVTSLDGSVCTEADPIDVWAEAMLKLHKEHDIRVLGGCCGTSVEHLQALASG